MKDNITESADIYAAMAEIDEYHEDKKAEDKAIMAPFGTKTKVVVVGSDGKLYEVPTSAYISQLEHLVKMQATEIKNLGRQIRSLSSAISSQKLSVMSTNRRLENTQKELDNKIDRRD